MYRFMSLKRFGRSEEHTCFPLLNLPLPPAFLLLILLLIVMAYAEAMNCSLCELLTL